MEIIKNINNNFALAKDNKGNTIIIGGRGIGFGNVPRKVEDLSKIERTYREIDKEIIAIIPNLSEDVVEITRKIVDRARDLIPKPINQSIYFSLADHIEFAIARAKEKVTFATKLFYEIQYTYETEMEIGKEAVRLINKEMVVNLNDEEAAIIAMHIVEAENWREEDISVKDLNKIVGDVIDIIQNNLGIKVKENGFDYFRFVTHIKYLLQRFDQKEEISTENKRIFEKLKEEFPKIYDCVIDIKKYLEDKNDRCVADEELLYLMLHINRLYSKEECNQ